MTHIAVDQYGQTFPLHTKHPRKELLGYLGYKKAQRMFRDQVGGGSRHVGWVIGPHWLDVYKCEPLEQK